MKSRIDNSNQGVDHPQDARSIRPSPVSRTMTYAGVTIRCSSSLMVSSVNDRDSGTSTARRSQKK